MLRSSAKPRYSAGPRSAAPRTSAAPRRQKKSQISAGRIDYHDKHGAFKLYYTNQLTPGTGLDGEFHAYLTIANLPNEDKVINILRYCAYIVAPIMLRHGWHIPMLIELPSTAEHLGTMTSVRRVTYTTQTNSKRITDRKAVVEATSVSLQVRSPDYPGEFVAIDSIVQTLLHELAHIGDGDHNLAFYRRNAKLLKELKKDWSKGHLTHMRGRHVPEDFANRYEIGGFKKLLCAL